MEIIATIAALYFLYWMVCERQNIKNHYYADHTVPSGIMDSDTLTAGSKALTKAERKAYAILSQVRPDTIWGASIYVTLGKGTVRAFRKLIRELYTEGIACESSMMRIIGRDGWDAVCRCRPWYIQFFKTPIIWLEKQKLKELRLKRYSLRR